MMSLSEKIRKEIEPYYLLGHPFYQQWMEGRLKKETLQKYAKQYHHHVSHFARYISATHAQCSSIEHRRLLVENLMDEEGMKGVDHPELWARFAEGLGVERRELENQEYEQAICRVVEVFTNHAHASFGQGLASLYAYEYQVPEIATSKIEGLIRNYQIEDPRTLSFFRVHQAADVYHRKACEEILDSMKEPDHEKAIEAALESSKVLWDFLSSLEEKNLAALRKLNKF